MGDNPKGAVGFFLEYYSEDHILDDIKKGLSISVLMYRETLLGQSQLRNEICRLFVQPSYQNKGLERKCLILLKK